MLYNWQYDEIQPYVIQWTIQYPLGIIMAGTKWRVKANFVIFFPNPIFPSRKQTHQLSINGSHFPMEQQKVNST